MTRARGGRDADPVHQLDGLLLGASLLGRAPVRPEHLADLEADRVDRVQRGQRVLEDHRDARAADPAGAARRHREQVAALEADRRRR